ncbi:MAG: hypothetical protein ACKE51_07095 [Methylococcaceae bacterium]
MKIKRILKIFLGFFLCLNPFLSTFAAGTPTGQFDFTFDEPKIWDISGTYEESFGGIDIEYTLFVDESGKITGTGTAFTNQSGVTVNAILKFTGTIKGKKGVTRIKMKFTMDGTATSNGQPYKFSAKAKVKQEINKTIRRAIGQAKGKVCIKSQRCTKVSGSFDFDLKDDMDGSWKLTLDLLEAKKNKIAGIGTITLSNGRVFSTNIKGKYSRKKEKAKLKLKNATGSKLSITSLVEGLTLEITKLKGKVMRQKLK